MPADTIFALATPPGRSGVAVVRISGADSARILEQISGRELPTPRHAQLRPLHDSDGHQIDSALVLFFRSPASFTGEDCVELHLHGGPAVIEAVCQRLVELTARPAEAGEFTRRAFEHGKLDLTEAEGLADLIDAETSAQREQALSQMSGALRTLYETWRQRLLGISAAIEGEIDFPDEDGVPTALAETARATLEELMSELESHLDDDCRGERIRKGFQIAIIGPPNAGKSSLLNAIAGQDAAIVTDIPGTTRDIVEVRLVLGGFAVTLADTAGLRSSQDPIEREGIQRALTRADSADYVVGVLDSSAVWSAEMAAVSAKADVLVCGKSDLPSKLTLPDSDIWRLQVSAHTRDGIEGLVGHLTEVVSERLRRREQPALSRARHRRNVQRACDALGRARDQLAAPELAGEDVRLAIQALEGLTGRIDVEDVLGEVFSRFCIGK